MGGATMKHALCLLVIALQCQLVIAAEPATTAASEPPLKLPNITFFQNFNPKEFTAGIDSETIRVPGGEPAAVLSSDTPRWGDGGSSLR